MNSLHLVQAHPWLSDLILFGLLIVGLIILKGGYSRRLVVDSCSRWRNHQAAEQRAADLLRDNVSANDYQQLRRDGYLEVPSRVHPGRIYRIPARPGRVAVYEAGDWVGELCLVAWDPTPYADLILAQKWLIEADEPAYLNLANWIGGSARDRERQEFDYLVASLP